MIEVIKNPVDDIRTNDTPFVVGETVVGQTSGCRLKLVDANNGFTDGLSPYDQSELPSSYASTTPYLNIDTKTMSDTVMGSFYGNPLEGEILVGATSGARAVVKPKRMVSNTNGDMEGIMWIPNPAVSTNPRFATGTRVIRMTTSDQLTLEFLVKLILLHNITTLLLVLLKLNNKQFLQLEMLIL